MEHAPHNAQAPVGSRLSRNAGSGTLDSPCSLSITSSETGNPELPSWLAPSA
jgi:hypothetical protein